MLLKYYTYKYPCDCHKTRGVLLYDSRLLNSIAVHNSTDYIYAYYVQYYSPVLALLLYVQSSTKFVFHRHLCPVFTFYTVIISTDFENIKKKGDHFRNQFSLLLYKM